jgi:hypothetical protein
VVNNSDRVAVSSTTGTITNSENNGSAADKARQASSQQAAIMATPVNEQANITTVPATEAALQETTGYIISAVDNRESQAASTGNAAMLRPGKERDAMAEKKMPLGIKSIQSFITMGPNLSFKSSKENYGNVNHKSKPGVGFQFGFGTSYYFTDRFAITPSLLFKHNTATETISYNTTGEPGGGAAQETSTKYSYSYLSVPILATVKINKQLTVMAGPEANLLVGAKTRSKYAGNTEKEDISSSSVKAGLGVQAGVKYDIPGSPIGIQLIYDHRISRLNKKSSEYYTGGGGYTTPAWNMKSIQLGVTCAICEFLKGMRK